MNTSMAPARLAMSGELVEGEFSRESDSAGESDSGEGSDTGAGESRRSSLPTWIYVCPCVWHMLTWLVNVSLSAVWLLRGAAGLHAR